MRNKLSVIFVLLVAGMMVLAETLPYRSEWGFTADTNGRFTGNGASLTNIPPSGLAGLESNPAADRIVFYDFSAGGLRYLTAGSGLSISGTTITATGSGSQTPWLSDIDADGFSLLEFDYVRGVNDDADYSAGKILFTLSSQSGDVIITGGTNITAGDSARGGNIDLVGGRGGTGSTVGGDVTLTGGYGNTGTGGNIVLTPGTGAVDGVIDLVGTTEADTLNVSGDATVTGNVNANGPIVFDGVLGSDDTYSGPAVSGLNAGATIAQWDVVYMGATFEWLEADANGSGTYPAVGLAAAAGTDGNPMTVVTGGVVRNDAWNWIVGTVYLSETAGELTQTAPSASGSKVQVIGFAVSADSILVKPSSDYATIP